MRSEEKGENDVQRRERRLEQAKDASRIDGLLQRLAEITQYDAPPALRERLKHTASQRLATAPADKRRFAWLRPAFVALLIMVVGFSGVLIVHRSQDEGRRYSLEYKPDESPQTKETHTSSTLPLPEINAALPHPPPHLRTKLKPDTQSRRMIIRLPYSNSAVATGTDATIRVAMSQSELLSLGFPVNATVRDHRVLAELTLGDDGLPRAVSLPLPLEIVKEKK
jgi:hypothetical protein